MIKFVARLVNKPKNIFMDNAFVKSIFAVLLALIIFAFLKHHFSAKPLNEKHNHYDDDFDSQHETYDPELK